MTGRSPSDFREWQQRELLAARMRDLVRTPVRVSEQEGWDRYLEEKSTSALNYVHVRATYMEKYGVTATPADVEAWAKDATNAATVEGATIRHVLVKISKGAKDDEKAAAKARLEKAIERIKKGEAFADVAREVSQDPGSAMRGGDVGTKTDGFVEPFKKAADAIKAGEMTGVVETTYGFHVIRKDDDAKEKRKKAYLKAKSLEAAKDLASENPRERQGREIGRRRQPRGPRPARCPRGEGARAHAHARARAPRRTEGRRGQRLDQRQRRRASAQGAYPRHRSGATAAPHGRVVQPPGLAPSRASRATRRPR